MSIRIQEKQFMLLMMAIEIATRWALRQSDESLEDLINGQEKRKSELMAELKSPRENSILFKKFD